MNINKEELDVLRKFLITKNKPLLDYVLEASIQEAKNLNAKVINCYLCNIHLLQFYEMTYKDSNM